MTELEWIWFGAKMAIIFKSIGARLNNHYSIFREGVPYARKKDSINLAVKSRIIITFDMGLDIIDGFLLLKSRQKSYSWMSNQIGHIKYFKTCRI